MGSLNLSCPNFCSLNLSRPRSKKTCEKHHEKIGIITYFATTTCEVWKEYERVQSSLWSNQNVLRTLNHIPYATPRAVYWYHNKFWI